MMGGTQSRFFFNRVLCSVWRVAVAALSLLMFALGMGAFSASAEESAASKSSPAKNQLWQAHQLLEAVLVGDTGAIQKLLDEGIDVNARAEAGVTAYHAARLLGDL